MGRKRKSSKKYTPKKTITHLSPEMVIIIMILIGIILGVVIYTGAGQIGKTINPVLGGLVGIIKYIVPIGFIFTGITLIKEDSSYVTTKIAQLIFFVICITVLMHVYNFSKINIQGNITFEEIVNESYKLGTTNKGGGAIGAIVATPITKLIGAFGTALLSIFVEVIIALFAFLE